MLVLVAVAGCVLVPVGALLLYLGVSGDHGGESVAGILALVLGLACVRILFWVRRARLLTRVGLSFHHPEDQS
jgi:Flp pilus assembly protein TadB